MAYVISSRVGDDAHIAVRLAVVFSELTPRNTRRPESTLTMSPSLSLLALLVLLLSVSVRNTMAQSDELQR